MRVTRASVYVALIFLSACATSTSTGPSEKYPGYAVSDPIQAVRTGNNECLRAGTPDPSVIVGECEPERVARQAPPVAETPPPPAAEAPPPPAAEAPPPPAAEAPPPEPAEVAAAPAEPAPQEAQPAPPAPEPSEQIAVVPPPAEPAAPAEPERTLEQIVLGTDAYFGFDQAELTDQARRKLDTIVVERARSAEEPRVRIVGHADRIGSPDYNLNLSQRRADAVRAYLVEQGLNEAAIEVEARGENDPIVQCEGQMGTSLIDCLQVNRRSEIEFSALEPVDR